MAIVTPFLAVDGVIELFDGPHLKGVVLIKRKNPPFGWALPGGFVDVGETVEAALAREMKEETSLEVTRHELIGVYSDPARDARFHTVSLVYRCSAAGTPVGADDAKEARVYALNELGGLELAFDHKQILQDYLKKYHAL
ncbi:MAG: NUDIX domain-containing protein [Campylobacterales bacterium]